jgi:hypothetical protein
MPQHYALFGLSIPYWVVTVVASELLMVLVRARELNILVKSKAQRTSAERRQVEWGLFRSVCLEIIVFVPVSAVLCLLVVRPLLALKATAWGLLPMNALSFYAALGIISYGFPFATLRRIATRVALNTLKDFASLENADEILKDRTTARSAGLPDN